MSTSGLITILLFFGFTFLSWLFGKLKEQAEANRQRQAVERRREEALRTGRGVQTQRAPQPAQGPYDARRQEGAAQASMSREELAARRQAQLRAMREEQLRRLRQGSQQRPAQGAAPAQQTRQAPARPGQPSVRPATPPQRQPQRRLQQPAQRPTQRTPQASPTSRKQQELLRRQAEAARRAREMVESSSAEQHPARRVGSMPTAAPLKPRTEDEALPRPIFGDKPLTIAELRRAVVLNEILSPPVGMREHHARDPYRI